MRSKLGENVEEGRTTAGRTGEVWKELAERALSMTKPEVTSNQVIAKPTWEDIKAHTECVGMVMGLRNSDRVGVPHERSWERQAAAEKDQNGPKTRSGWWGCAACRLREIEKARVGKGTDREGGRPRATLRHWLTGRCEGAKQTCREDMARAAKEICTAVNDMAGDGAEAIKQTCEMARRGAEKATKGGLVSAEEWAALAQTMAAQLPMCAASKRIEAAVDAARRQMVRAAVEQQHHTTELSRKMETWRRNREEHRGWMKVVLIAWAHVAQRGERIQHLKALSVNGRRDKGQERQ